MWNCANGVVFFLLICSFNLSVQDDTNSECVRLNKKYSELEVQYKKDEQTITGLRSCYNALYKGHGYYFSQVATTWGEAEQLCRDIGGHIAFQELKSEHQREELYKNLTVKIKFTNMMKHQIWIGGSGENKVFYWPDDPKQSISKNKTIGWCSGEPNNGKNKEKCLHYNRLQGNIRHRCLNDISCNGKNSVLCEIKCNYN